MIRPGSLVIGHLIKPTEKFWGILQELGVAGVSTVSYSIGDKLALIDSIKNELMAPQRATR